MATGPVTRSAVAQSQPTAADLASVRVALTAAKGRKVALGTALDALRDGRLTAAERHAIMALVHAVKMLRERAALNGVDDAGAGVELLLRDTDANERGPWATTGQIAVGARNGLATRRGSAARADVLLTVDAAVHELTHVVQFGRMSTKAKPHPALLEGIADAAAILATGDDTLGEEFFNVDASGRYRGSIRELGAHTTTGPALGHVITNYHDAVRPGTEEHAGGGVVAATFMQVRARLGRERAEQLLWAVIRDTAAWNMGGSWKDLVLSLRRQVAAVWAGDTAAASAVEAALSSTALDAAAR
ncbi:MAG: hypothetical protein JWL76_1539 [Thermoleophilia bacterium]|nr:hypothetical protein [Thermoleophilia bacterium]